MTDILRELIGNAPTLLDQQAIDEVMNAPIVSELHYLQALKLIQDASYFGGLTISFGSDGSWVAVSPFSDAISSGSSHRELLGFLKRRSASKRQRG